MSNYVISEAFDKLRNMQSKKKLIEDAKSKKYTSKKVVRESKKSHGLKILNEDLKIIMSMSSYQPWSGAVETCERIKDAGLWDNFESVLEDIYPEGITETQLNDILWFEPEWCYEMVGLSDGEEDEDEVDESLDKKSNKTKCVDKKECKGDKCDKESMKESRGQKRYTFSDMLKDKIDFYDSFEVKDNNGNKGTRYMLSNKLTDEQKANLSQYPNVVVSSATHKYAPEISHDSIIILNRGMESKNESKLTKRTYKINESKLVEKEMSPEDKADNEVIRDVYNRVNKRSNAKITKDQQKVLDKHGIKVNKKYNGLYDRYNTTLVDQSGDDLGNKVSSYVYNGHNGPRKEIKNDKVNLADRARKSKERGERRKELRDTPVWNVPGSDYENEHGELSSAGIRYTDRHPELTRERKIQAKKMYEPVSNMKDALSDRKTAKNLLTKVDKEFEDRIASAKRDYDKRVSDAKSHADYIKSTYKELSDDADSRINKLLMKEALLNEKGDIDDGKLFDEVTEQVENFVTDMFIQFQSTYNIEDRSLGVRTQSALDNAQDRLVIAITNGLLEQYGSAE